MKNTNPNFEVSPIGMGEEEKDKSCTVGQLVIPTQKQYEEAKETLSICQKWVVSIREELSQTLDKICSLRGDEIKYLGYIDKLKEMILIYETAHQGEQK